jgi:hypothetical protein
MAVRSPLVSFGGVSSRLRREGGLLFAFAEGITWSMDRERFESAVAAFDQANSKDPTREEVGGVAHPRELLHAERLAAWVERLEPSASEALRLAARCQHLERWKIPRSSHPEGRVGYLQWRTQLGRFHADRAAEILAAAGYDRQLIDQVRRINLKQGLRSDPDVQTMEDALCLSFIEHEFDAFAAKHEDQKLIEILRKTWKKMSRRGHEAALKLQLSPRVRDLLGRALNAPE